MRIATMATILAATALAGTALLGAASTATAHVPPVKGNDTGGIVSYHSYPPEMIRDIAFSHCAAYGKTAKLTGAQMRYGGYISFACVWQRPSLRDRAISVRY